MAMADEEIHPSKRRKMQLLPPPPPHRSSSSFVNLGSLPESCIALILADTTPLDVCRLSSVNRLFKAASDSDLVWKRMLPQSPSSSDSFQNSDCAPVRFPSKKSLYRCLSEAVPLCHGTQKYWLDPRTGGECYMLSARALEISWGDDARYWDWIPRAGSWFQDVAFLKGICWLEIQGQFRQFLKAGTYTVSFRIQMGTKIRRYHVGNWGCTPVKLSLSTSNGQREESLKYLLTGLLPPSDPPRSSNLNPLMFMDDWVECDAGEFVVEHNRTPVEVHFSMTEIETLKWKGDLILDGVLIRPSDIVKQSCEKKRLGMLQNQNMACPFISPEGDEEETLQVENGNASGSLRKRCNPWQKPSVTVLKTFSRMMSERRTDESEVCKMQADENRALDIQESCSMDLEHDWSFHGTDLFQESTTEFEERESGKGCSSQECFIRRGPGKEKQTLD